MTKQVLDFFSVEEGREGWRIFFGDDREGGKERGN